MVYFQLVKLLHGGKINYDSYEFRIENVQICVCVGFRILWARNINFVPISIENKNMSMKPKKIFVLSRKYYK